MSLSFIEPFDHVNHMSVCGLCCAEYWFRDKRTCVFCNKIGCDNCMSKCYLCDENYSCERHMVLSTANGYFDNFQLICVKCNKTCVKDRTRARRIGFLALMFVTLVLACSVYITVYLIGKLR